MFTKEAAEKCCTRSFFCLGGRCPCNLAVDFRPLRQSAEVAVVDVEVSGDFATGLIGGRRRGKFLGIVGVDGVEFETSLGAPCHCLFEKLAFTDCPQYEAEVGHVTLKLPQSSYGERALFTYGRITVLDDCAVEVYCYCHFTYCMNSGRTSTAAAMKSGISTSRRLLREPRIERSRPL